MQREDLAGGRCDPLLHCTVGGQILPLQNAAGSQILLLHHVEGSQILPLQHAAGSEVENSR